MTSRELEPISAAATDAAAQAFAREEQIKSIVRRMRADWITLAKHLYEFLADECWRHLGYESISAWLASPDIDLGYRHVYGLVEVHRELILHRGVDPARLAQLPSSKVRDVMPAIRSGRAELEEALNDVEVLGRNDLRDRYSGVGEIDRPLRAETETRWMTCQSCGSRIRATRQ